MTELQILNKIINTKDFGLILKNALTEEHFPGYEDEFNFIRNHLDEYGQIPDLETFIGQFRNFEPIEVLESDDYLIDALLEEHLYYKSVGVVQKLAELLKSNANDAVEYLRSEIPNLEVTNKFKSKDLIQDADDRYNLYLEKKDSDQPWYITTGFEELDLIINGWAKGEEFAVIFARTGQGKSWVLAKTLSHAWKLGNRVGYISPEMSPEKIGYRYDTLIRNFSNQNLVWGREEKGYKEYIEEIKENDNPFLVSTPKDFQKKITVGKLRQFCKGNNLDILGIDGITYLTDERYKKGDNKTTSLTNISEDLSLLSMELGIPILVVVQSNRGGVKDNDDEGTPDLENIRDSDGIAQNATKVISLRQSGAGLEFGIKKHRDGAAGGKLTYFWDIDKGIFDYIPSTEDSTPSIIRDKKTKQMKDTFKDVADVF